MVIKNNDYSKLVKLRELAVNDIALRMKVLHKNKYVFSETEFVSAKKLARQAYDEIVNNYIIITAFGEFVLLVAFV